MIKCIVFLSSRRFFPLHDLLNTSHFKYLFFKFNRSFRPVAGFESSLNMLFILFFYLPPREISTS